MNTTPYQMIINNTARYIKEHPHGTPGNIDAFTASSVLAAGFCKDKEEIMDDLSAARSELVEDWRYTRTS